MRRPRDGSLNEARASTATADETGDPMTSHRSAVQDPAKSAQTAAMSLAALGIVFGDIGTSPLYTLKTVLDYTGPHPDVGATLGALSLILWTLFVITTIKYVNFAM